MSPKHRFHEGWPTAARWIAMAGSLLWIGAIGVEPARSAVPPRADRPEASATGMIHSREGLPPRARVAIDELRATGTVYRLGLGGIVQAEPRVVLVTDTLDLHNPVAPPRDTIPALCHIDVRWHSEPIDPGGLVVGYEYTGPGGTVVVDSSVTSASFDLGPNTSSTVVFIVRAIGASGPLANANRRFAVGYAPDSWFSGPDRSLYPLNPATGERSIEVADWSSPPPFPGSLLSCDTVTTWPAERPERRTFFEIYQNRVYARSEDDTVHLNSWVLFHNGGSDLDSPYDVRVNPTDPALPDSLACGEPYRTLKPSPPNGSPIAFRLQVSEFLDPAGPLMIPSVSLRYPNFDPNSFARMPVVGGYWPMSQSGIAYAVARGVDGDGLQEPGVPNPKTVVDTSPPGDPLRRRVLRFYVNQAPTLLMSHPLFVPKPGQVFVDRSITLNLLATDSDPLDPSNPPPGFGGPSSAPVLRWNVRVLGLNPLGDPVSYSPLPEPIFSQYLKLDVPESVAGPDATIEVELCDCRDCEALPGSGRCVKQWIPIRIPAATTATLAVLVSAEATAERVRLRWRVERGATARVERRGVDSWWRSLGDAPVDGSSDVTYEDRAIEPDARYAYRLVPRMGDREETTPEVWVQVPSRAELSLAGARPNPGVQGELTVHFSLAESGNARLELLDLSGRRVLVREVGGLGPGSHAVSLGLERRVPPGVYLVRLSQGRDVRVARAVVLN